MLKGVYIFALVIGLIIGVLSGIFELSNWVFVVVILVYVAIIIGYYSYLLLKSKNLSKIQKFVAKNKKNPIYRYMLLNSRDASAEEKIAALEEVLSKYKKPNFQATYGVMLNILKEDYDEAENCAKPLLGTEEGDYNLELIRVLKGDLQAPSRTFKKQWMNDSIKANIAYMQKDLPKFDEYVERSLSNTGGLQYFNNYYSFKQLRLKLQA